MAGGEERLLQGDDLTSYWDWFGNAKKLVDLKIPEALDMAPLDYIDSLPQPNNFPSREGDLASRIIVEPRVKPSVLLSLLGIDFSMIESGDVDQIHNTLGVEFRVPTKPYFADVDILEVSAGKRLINRATFFEGASYYIKNGGRQLLRPEPLSFPRSRFPGGRRGNSDRGSGWVVVIPGFALVAGSPTLVGHSSLEDVRPGSRILIARRYT